MDSKEEATYRLNLARFHLEQAKKSFDSQLYPIAAKEVQLSIENSAKAVVSCVRKAAKTHDPGAEVREIVKEYAKQIGKDLKRRLEKFAKRD